MLLKFGLTAALVGMSISLSSCTTGEEMTQFGEKMTLSESTAIAMILADPDAHLGKKVQIAGTIADVCQNQGCWIEVSGSEPGQKLKVKVKDGEIVFPGDAKGKKTVAEGELYKIELDAEQALAYLEHAAEERGEMFDPETAGGPLTIYQIKGAGALIEE